MGREWAEPVGAAHRRRAWLRQARADWNAGQAEGIGPCRRLEDIDYGAWTGLTPAEVAGRWPEEYRRWREDPETLVLPGGESLQGVRSRVAAAIAEWGSRSAGSTVVLVTHDVAIRAAICSALRAPLAAMHRIRVGLASVTVLRVAGGEVFLERVNDQHHLEGR